MFCLNTSDSDDCETLNGGCDHICIDHEGGFECQCRSGFVLAGNNRSCDDIDECSAVEPPCNQTCVNLPGDFRCECLEGYVLEADGTSCRGKSSCLN